MPDVKQKLAQKTHEESTKLSKMQEQGRVKPKLTANEYYINSLKSLTAALKTQNSALEDLKSTVNLISSEQNRISRNQRELVEILHLAGSPEAQKLLKERMARAGSAHTNLQELQSQIRTLDRSFSAMKSTIESTQDAVQTVKEVAQDIKEDAQELKEDSESLAWLALWALLCAVIMLTSLDIASVVGTVIAWVIAGVIGAVSVGWFVTRFKKHVIGESEKPKKPE